MKLGRPKIAPWKIPAWAWKRLRLPAHKPRVGPYKLPVWFWPWRGWRLGHKPTRKAKPVTMYDSVTVTEIPKRAKAVAGYVGGHWPTYPTLVKQFPKAHKLSIAIAASEDADCLDVEAGDATPGQAPSWVRRQHARGLALPVVYTSAAYLQSLVNLLAQHGLEHGRDYLIWSAHYTFHAHRCSPKCGFGIKVTADATQWSDKALRRNLDVSLCSPTFFGGSGA